PIGVILMITSTRPPPGLLRALLPESKMSPCPVWAAAAAADAAIMAEIINAKKRIKNRESNREIPIAYPPSSGRQLNLEAPRRSSPGISVLTLRPNSPHRPNGLARQGFCRFWSTVFPDAPGRGRFRVWQAHDD